MSVPATPTPTGLVRVGILVDARRRVDLAVPGGLPVADLVAEVLALAGPLDRDLVAHGPVLVTVTGRRLSPADGLLDQGVVDGALLAVLPATEELLAHDDVAQAVASVVEAGAASGRATRVAAPLAGAALALGVGLAGLVVADAGGAATTLAAVLLAVAAVSARAGRPDAALVTGATACAHAAVAGWLLTPATEGVLGLPLAVAGSAAAVTGAAGLGLLREHRLLLLPAVLVGVAVAACALLARAAAADPVTALLVLLVGATVGTQLHARVALATTSLTTWAGPGSSTAPTQEAVAGEVRSAQEVVLVLLASTGLVLVLVAPLAVAQGAAGAGLAAACALAVAAGATRHRAVAPAATGVVAGVVALLVAAAAVMVLHPGWRAAVAGVALAVGLLAAVAPRDGGGRGARARRVRDLVEAAAVASLPPLLCLAAGLVPAVASVVGDLVGGGR